MGCLLESQGARGVKVLVLCYEYPPVGGGGGRVAAQVAAGLSQRGHEVKVVTAGLRHLPRREVRDGVEILRPESFRKKEDTCTVPEMGLYLLTSFLPAWKVARRWKPDVIHVHFAVPSGPLAFVLRYLTGVPYVLTAHLGDVPGGVPEQTAGLFRLLGPYITPVWRKAAGTTAVSRFVTRLAQKAYGIQPETIPNGLPARAWPELVEHQTPRVLFVGRLSIQKNPLLALEALAAVRDLAWQCDFIGEGPLGEELRARAVELGLTDRVHFHGWLDAERLQSLLAEGDILLMTSLHEGLPMAAIEALQGGLAIVGSAIGGMEDVVDPERNGFLCELTPEAFAAKLRTLLEKPEILAQQRAASLQKAASFDLAHILDHYERVLLEASRVAR